MAEKVVKSIDEWRRQLTPEQYRVARMKGTERPFTGAYHATKQPGVYHCVCCGQPLFDAATKFESGTGWPSFFAPIDPDAVATETDRSLFMVRTEVLCSRCDAHLGHVFPDGPEPTGQRYCMNSASLRLVPKSDAEA
jgi:peptide-methionine (R)-S-oxide reductase